jgi:hypothetical protein
MINESGNEMTSKTTTTIGLSDIKAVEFECATCHMKVAYPIEKYSHPMMLCNVCQPSRSFIVQNSQEHRDLLALGDLIRRLSQMNVGMIVRFEISN